jgi:hypothetical protein
LRDVQRTRASRDLPRLEGRAFFHCRRDGLAPHPFGPGFGCPRILVGRQWGRAKGGRHTVVAGAPDLDAITSKFSRPSIRSRGPLPAPRT